MSLVRYWNEYYSFVLLQGMPESSGGLLSPFPGAGAPQQVQSDAGSQCHKQQQQN